MSDQEPFAVAGIWERWLDSVTQSEIFSFSMLTINADEHLLMKQFHRPGDEKRAVVIVSESQYDAWLGAAPNDAADLLHASPAKKMVAEAAELPPRKAK